MNAIEKLYKIAKTPFVMCYDISKKAWGYIAPSIGKVFSKDFRWSFLYTGGFTLGLLIMLRAFGRMPDVIAKVFDAGAKSVPLLIAIALTYAASNGLEWNLPNAFRMRCQRILSGDDEGSQVGAFLILAGELVGIMSLLIVLLLAMTWWAK